MRSDKLLLKVFYSIDLMGVAYNDWEEKLKDVREKLQLESAAANEEQKRQQEKIQSNVAVVRAFQRIAEAQGQVATGSVLPRPFDKAKLMQLQFGMGTGYNNSCTKELAIEAAAQLKWLERQLVTPVQGYPEGVNTSGVEQLRREEHEVLKRLEKTRKFFTQYFSSEEFTEFVELVRSSDDCWLENHKPCKAAEEGFVSIGTGYLPVRLPDVYKKLVPRELEDVILREESVLKVPTLLDINDGAVLISETNDGKESAVLGGVQTLLKNLMYHFDHLYSEAWFFDPVRYNDAALGCLGVLAEHDSFIKKVAIMPDEMIRMIDSVVQDITLLEREPELVGQVSNNKGRILVFQDFPHGYNEKTIKQIRQLCMNAKRYRLIVVLCSDRGRDKYHASNEILDLLCAKAKAYCIDDDSITGVSDFKKHRFKWYSKPERLPQQIEVKYLKNRPVVNKSNDYAERVGFKSLLNYHKGNRKLTDIPFGVDEETGKVMSLDFEDLNNSAFICGTTGSGKSTFLHTVLTGIIQNYHPDDVEIWLVDFKMTEFSRYIKNTPPHVRYIILDQSPELVYDLLDRLTEILKKRQIIFSNAEHQWKKIAEVPATKYMPALFVVIDEFSIMAQVISDSVFNGGEDYRLVLQNLLSQGRALGMHFILSSQGFETESRGLTPFAKDQIQQRIALKTSYSEIKSTLDIKSPSDQDEMLMRQLEPYHVLLRKPVDFRGNQLTSSKVLYISDFREQDELIRAARHSVVAESVYSASDDKKYIDKKTACFDGTKFTAFGKVKSLILQEIGKKGFPSYSSATSSLMLFLGEPRTIRSVFPVSLWQQVGENILILAPSKETASCASLMRAIAASADFQGREVVIASSARNEIPELLYAAGIDSVTSIPDICSLIHGLKERVAKGVIGNSLLIIEGAHHLLAQLGNRGRNENSPHAGLAELHFEKRAPGEPDLLTRLEAVARGEEIMEVEEENNTSPRNEDTTSYDALEDLVHIIKEGPQLGYHVVLQYSRESEIERDRRSGIELSDFKHKIMFRMPKIEAISLIGSAGAQTVAELPDHTFRYTDGETSLSFRPYLFPGIGWDGWRTDDGITGYQKFDEADEYLL